MYNELWAKHIVESGCRGPSIFMKLSSRCRRRRRRRRRRRHCHHC